MNVVRTCPEFYQLFNVVCVLLNQNAELFKTDFPCSPRTKDKDKIYVQQPISHVFLECSLKYKTPTSDIAIAIFSAMHKVLGSVPNNMNK